MNARIPVVVMAILVAGLDPAAGQSASFSDYDHLGLLEDDRREPTDLTVGPHVLEPSLNYKLFGVTTPHVFAAGSLGWTDNLLREDHDAPGVRLRREGYGRAEAGARLDTEFSDHRLELSYRSIVTEYMDSGQFDTLEHRGRARLDLYFVDLESHTDVRWARSAHPQSIQLTGIVKTETFGVRSWVEGRLGIFGLRVGGSAQRTDFLQGQLRDLDSRTYGADVQLYAKVFERLRALVEYNWTVVRYDEGRIGTLNDWELHQIRAGVDGPITEKLSLSFKAGFATQDVRTVQTVPSRDDREFEGVVAEVSLGYQVFPRTKLILAYNRSVLLSTSSNFLSTHEASIRVKQRIYDELRVEATATYTRSKVTRGDYLNRFSTSLVVTYRFTDWLSVAGVYRFTTLTSFEPNSDYRVHDLTGSVGVGF